MEKWMHEIITGGIVLLGIVLSYVSARGGLHATVKAHGEWLKSLSAENSATHKDLYQRIESEAHARNEMLMKQAESIQEHYVSRRECEAMHKSPINGGTRALAAKLGD